MKNTPLLFFISLLLVACSRSNAEKDVENDFVDHELVIVDSVQVDILTSTLVILDVHQNGNLLAIQPQPPAAYLLNPSGDILQKKEFIPGAPDAVGDLLLSGEFFEDGYALLGPYTIKTYDKDFNVRKVMRTTEHDVSMMYMGFNHLISTNLNEEEQLVAYVGAKTDLSPTDSKYYEAFTMVDKINPKNATTRTENIEGLFESIGSIPERYNNERTYFFITPHFDIDADQLYVTLNKDTTLYQYDLNTLELISKESIPFDNYILSKGLSIGKAAFDEQYEPRDAAGNISKYFRAGDKDVYVYQSGLKLSAIQDIPQDDNYQEARNKLNPYKILISKSGQRLNSDLTKPPKVGSLMMADDEGYLWAMQDISEMEEEPKMKTFYKIAIRQTRK